MGRSTNYIPFHLYKKIFPKVANKYVRQPKTCKLKLMHNGKVAHNGILPVLGMQDIDRLGLLSINHNSKNRQILEEDDKDNCENPRKTECDNCEQFKGKKQEAATQNTQEAKYLNPMDMGKNNKDSS